jgi:hypothetical protein
MHQPVRLLQGINMRRRPLPREQRWRWDLRREDVPARLELLHDQRFLLQLHRPRPTPLLSFQHL